MPLVLVSDTSVLVDLHRGGILDVALRLPYKFAVPDLLFERELRTWDGPALEGRLAILVLDAIGVALAAGYRRTDPRLSLPDAFALALAKTGGHTLLAGDASLRALADAEGVECHGVLWVLAARGESRPRAACGPRERSTRSIAGTTLCRWRWGNASATDNP